MADDLILPKHIRKARSNVVPFNINTISTVEVPDDTGIRQAMKDVIERRKKDPDFIKKQLDHEIPPTVFLSPEHYHISYECQGYTFPYTQHTFKRARLAYLEMWRLQSLSVKYAEPTFDEDAGTIDITTPVKGRTGMFRITLRCVECFLPACANNPSPLEPLLGAPDDGDIRL